MDEIKTRENDLVFEVMMAPKDHAAIVERMSELLNKIILSGTIFFLALCLIMSFIMYFTFEDINKSSDIVRQANSEIIALKAVDKNLQQVLNNQTMNRAKLNHLYSTVPALVNKPKGP